MSVDRPECREVDPKNRLFWRMNRQRLAFETSRDSMLQVAGQLQERSGGPPIRQSPDDPANKLRTIYNYIDRENLEDVFRVFDFPSPDISAPHRSQTTVPQQSLFYSTALLSLHRLLPSFSGSLFQCKKIFN